MMLTYDKLGQNGRFGNQLFQIASTIGMARELKMDYGFPVWEYQKYFVNQLPLRRPDSRSLKGYLQDYKLFANCEEEIRKLFTMNFGEIDMTDEVFIHFRAYSNEGEGISRYHPEQTKEYYEKAIQQFEGKQFIVFTDDIQKAKKVLPSEYTFVKSTVEIEDFYMMSNCDGGIISNSTFSWWAAWLMNKKTVIPKNWFTPKAMIENPNVYDSTGLYMPNWIVL